MEIARDPATLLSEIVTRRVDINHRLGSQAQLLRRLEDAGPKIAAEIERCDIRHSSIEYLRLAGVSVDVFDEVLQDEIRRGQWSLARIGRFKTPTPALRSASDDLLEAWRQALDRERSRAEMVADEKWVQIAEIQSLSEHYPIGDWPRPSTEYLGSRKQSPPADPGASSYPRPRWNMEIQPLDEIRFTLPHISLGDANTILLPASSGLSFADAAGAARGLVLEEMANSEPDLLQVNWLDVTGLSENAGELLEVARAAPAAFRYQTLHTPAEIQAALNEAWQTLREVQDLYLRKGLPDLQSYNEVALAAEAHRVLVITGFPRVFDKDSAEILARISRYGSPAGFSVVVVADPFVASSFTSIDRLSRAHQLQDIPVAEDALPDWWGPNTLPAGRIVVGDQEFTYTPTVLAPNTRSYLTLCHLRIPDRETIRQVSQGYVEESESLVQWGLTPHGLETLRSDQSARRNNLMRAMLDWLATETRSGRQPPDWESFISTGESHLGGEQYSRDEILQGAQYLFDKDFIDSEADVDEPQVGTSRPRLSSKGVDMVNDRGNQSTNDFSAAQRRVKNETRIDGPVIFGDSLNSNFAWSRTGPVSQTNQTATQVAPGFEELARAVGEVLANLGRMGLATEDAEDAEASAREVLTEVERATPDRSKIRRALAALKGLLMPVANQAALGVGEGAHDVAKAALDHLQGVIF